MELQECWRRFLGWTYDRWVTTDRSRFRGSPSCRLQKNMEWVMVFGRNKLFAVFFVEENNEQQWFSASNHCYKVGWNLVCNSPKLTAKSFCKNRANLPQKDMNHPWQSHWNFQGATLLITSVSGRVVDLNRYMDLFENLATKPSVI